MKHPKTIAKRIVILPVILAAMTIVPLWAQESSPEFLAQREKVFQAAVENMNLGNYEKAEKGFRKILEQEPDNLNAHYYLGLIKYEQQLLPAALGFFRWVEKTAPQMPVVHYYLGLIAYDQQDWDGALKEMEKAKNLDPKLSMVEYYLGLIHYKKMETTAAETSFRSAIKLEPSLSMAHYALAYLLHHDLKEKQAAILEITAGLKGNAGTKLRGKLVSLLEEIQGPEREADIGKNPAPQGPPPMPGTPGEQPFGPPYDGHFIMGAGMAGPPDAPDFHERPLFGPGFQGIPPPPGFPADAGPWKKRLGLSDAQSSEVDTLWKKQMEELKRLHKQMWKDREALRSTVKVKTKDDEIEKLLDALSRDRKNFADSMGEFEDQIRAILTPRQRAQIMLGLDRDDWMKPPKHGGNWKTGLSKNSTGVETEELGNPAGHDQDSFPKKPNSKLP